MSKLTRRQAIELIGVGTSLAFGMRPGSLPAQTRTRIFIGTAGKGGVFYPLGTAMAAVISKYASEVEAIAPETNGTVENIKLLQEGKIELALAQPDIAWAATQGRLDDLRKMVPVRNLLGTRATYLHLVTLAGRGSKRSRISEASACPQARQEARRTPERFACCRPMASRPTISAPTRVSMIPRRPRR
jgi:uncharacterized protein